MVSTARLPAYNPGYFGRLLNFQTDLRFRVKHLFFGRQAMKVFKRVGMTLNEIEEIPMLPPCVAPRLTTKKF
jgi:hypothetical protein